MVIARKSITNMEKIVSLSDEYGMYGYLVVLGGSLIVRRLTWWSTNSQRIPKVVKPKPRPFRTKLKKKEIKIILQLLIVLVCTVKIGDKELLFVHH